MPPFAAAGQPPRPRADPADGSLRLRLSPPANDRGAVITGPVRRGPLRRERRTPLTGFDLVAYISIAARAAKQRFFELNPRTKG